MSNFLLGLCLGLLLGIGTTTYLFIRFNKKIRIALRNTIDGM